MRKHRLIKIIAAALSLIVAMTGIYFAATSKKATVKTETLFSKVLSNHGFVYGINYPWMGFGYRQYTGKTDISFSEKAVSDGLYNIKQIGLDAVQIWLFNRTEGLIYDESGDIIGVQKEFLQNVRKTCEIAKELDIYLAFTVQPHFDYTLESGLYSGSKEIYDKYTRFVTDPSVRKNYIEKAVKPALEVLADYPEILFGITAYCEPEGDIYGTPNGYKPWGTSIEVMTDFIAAITDASREVLPNVPVSVASGWDYSDSVQYFNRLNLDYIGMDIYDDNGDVQNLQNMALTSPAVMTEFGPLEKAGSSNSYFHITNYQTFISNAKLGGYVGAFYWCYSGKGTMQSLLGSSNYDYLPLASAVHYQIIDDRNAQAGKEDEYDVPVMLAPDTDGTLKFICSRNAETYIIERSQDGETWTEAGSISADSADRTGSLIGSYTDQGAEQGVTYVYRVTAVDYDGTRTTSVPSRKTKTMKTTCSESENLYSDYSFENTDKISKDHFSWISDTNGKHFSIVTGTAGDTVHTGTRSLRIEGNNDWSWIGRNITGLTPNTDYVFTFYVYADGDGSIHGKVMSKDRQTNLYQATTSSAYQQQWIRYTAIVNTGDNDEVIIGFSDVGGTVNIDDIYFFPYTE